MAPAGLSASRRQGHRGCPEAEPHGKHVMEVLNNLVGADSLHVFLGQIASSVSSICTLGHRALDQLHPLVPVLVIAPGRLFGALGCFFVGTCIHAQGTS